MDDNLANGDATMQPGQDVEVKFANEDMDSSKKQSKF